MNPEKKNCQNCKNIFIIEPDDFAFYQKIGVPAPLWCPFCRFIRKMTYVNERSLYKRACGRCEKSIISMYHPDTELPVWCPKCHMADDWDASEYGKEYDFSRPFFAQFKDLKFSVPHRSLDQNEKNGKGCEYSNFCYSGKEVYLSFNTHLSENIKYSKYVLRNNKNLLDSFIVKDNDRGYELVQARQNYNSSFLIESDQCIDSHFLYDCLNCVNCCMSSNIRNKSYVFKNQQLSKEAYKDAMEELALETYSGQVRAKGEFTELVKGAIHKYAHIKNSVNAVGDFIENSKNAYHCYGLVDAENMKYVYFGVNTTKDSQDLIFTGRGEECYELAYGGRGINKVRLSFSCGSGSQNLLYCDNCKNCSDCFGCVALDKKQYCILNKRYTKEEYFNLIEKIKTHMSDMSYKDKAGRIYPFGEYFPTELSPFAYNETVAFEENPLSKEEVISLGYRWRDLEPKLHTPTVRGIELPDSINDVSDAICDEIIECPNQGKVESQCTSAFRILSDELAFYRQMKLPIPRYCPNCRYHYRLVWKNPFHFYKRPCMCDLPNHSHQGKCEVEFETAYSPDRSEIVYCEKCYQQEVV